MRSIDADALERALGYLWVVTAARDTDDKETSTERAAMCRGIDVCIGIVQRAPTIGGWIRVEDRLPEKETEVLVAVFGHDVITQMLGERLNDTAQRIRMTRYTTTGFIGDDGWYTGDGYPMIVLPSYWMPLPEPPEVDA